MIPQSIIENAIDKILEDEGDLSDVEGDKGGLTNFGITQATADDLKVGDVRKLTLDGAREAYRMLIARWNIPQISDPQTFMLVADACTNNGPVNGVRWLQRAIGIPLEHQDGVLGPQTTAALAGVTDWSQVFGKILAQRIAYYGKLVVKYPDQAKFLLGWLNRCVSFVVPFPKWL